MTLAQYYESLYPTMDNEFEGHCQRCPAEAKMLQNLIQDDSIRTVMEIGFNAGHSAEIFLENNPNITLISFDLGEHEYVKKGKSFLDQKYPTRHTLILGDSRQTVPNYHLEHPEQKFDLIFIDGGHEHGIPFADIQNCRKFAHSRTIVIFDDVKKINARHFNTEPTKAWYSYVDRNLIKEIGQYDFSNTHGLAYGKYNTCELFICSLGSLERQDIIEKNKKIFPTLKIFPSVNGYDEQATKAELSKLNLEFHSLGFKTYGTLANWITKYKFLHYQVRYNIQYACFIEDDVLLTPEFEDFMHDAVEYFKDSDLNIVRLNTWGEGYITSYESAQRLLKILSETGIVLNIDDQLRLKSGKELYLQNNFMKLQIGTNQGDCLKTKSFDTL